MTTEFLEYWCAADLDKAFSRRDCYSTHPLMFDKHLKEGFIMYVTYGDIGMHLGCSPKMITETIYNNRTHIKISDFGKQLILMREL